MGNQQTIEQATLVGGVVAVLYLVYKPGPLSISAQHSMKDGNPWFRLPPWRVRAVLASMESYRRLSPNLGGPRLKPEISHPGRLGSDRGPGIKSSYLTLQST